jgi:dTDP-4-dehydrorhamnose reductase
MTRPIIITGAEGQLGSELSRRLGTRSLSLSRSELNITDKAQIEALIERAQPSAVINCAAYTAVDRAEQEPDWCYAVNATAVELLAKEADRAGATLIQISSDYVFGGDASRTQPYVEADTPAPQGIYAKSKLLGEQAAQTCERHLIVRTCGLYGRRTKSTQSNFVDTMLRLGAERPKLRVVGDQRCTPSLVSDVAGAILKLLERQAQGTFHVVNEGQTTWYDFAKKIFALRGLSVEIERISTENYGAPAPRPRYSLLSTAKYRALTGQSLPSWEEALARYLNEMA